MGICAAKSGPQDEEEEEDEPMPANFAKAGDSIFFTREKLEKAGVDIDADLGTKEQKK